MTRLLFLLKTWRKIVGVASEELSFDIKIQNMFTVLTISIAPDVVNITDLEKLLKMFEHGVGVELELQEKNQFVINHKVQGHSTGVVFAQSTATWKIDLRSISVIVE